MGITGDWRATFELIDKYPIRPNVAAAEPEPAAPVVEEPKVQVYPPKKPLRSIRAGSTRAQVLDAVEIYPDRTVSEITSLVGKEDEEVSAVAAVCKSLIDKKLLVRSKNEKGIFTYRLPAQANAH